MIEIGPLCSILFYRYFKTKQRRIVSPVFITAINVPITGIREQYISQGVVKLSGKIVTSRFKEILNHCGMLARYLSEAHDCRGMRERLIN